jgi:mono/diheme cytochrome c family protein
VIHRTAVRSVQAVVLGCALASAGSAIARASGRAAQQPGRTSNDSVFSAEQATRGQSLYQEQCASCHGATLAGAEAAPALAGSPFVGTWAEVPLADLFERIRLSMPQDKPGTLGRQQTADIVAYILSYNKAPAGQTELPGEIEVLKGIRIVPAQ